MVKFNVIEYYLNEIKSFFIRNKEGLIIIGATFILTGIAVIAAIFSSQGR